MDIRRSASRGYWLKGDELVGFSRVEHVERVEEGRRELVGR